MPFYILLFFSYKTRNALFLLTKIKEYKLEVSHASPANGYDTDCNSR